jgi:hypothetical protein
MNFLTGSLRRWFDLDTQMRVDEEMVSEMAVEIRFFGPVNKTL